MNKYRVTIRLCDEVSGNETKIYYGEEIADDAVEAIEQAFNAACSTAEDFGFVYTLATENEEYCTGASIWFVGYGNVAQEYMVTCERIGDETV